MANMAKRTDGGIRSPATNLLPFRQKTTRMDSGAPESSWREDGSSDGLEGHATLKLSTGSVHKI